MLKKIVRRYVPSRPKSEISAQSRRLFDGSNVRRIQTAAPSALGIGTALHKNKNGLGRTPEGNFDSPQAAPVPKPLASRLAESPALRFGIPTAVGMGLVGLFAPAMLPMTIVTMGLMGSILLHEMAQLVMLKHFGDPTPDEVGRGSLNPLRHVDLLGTILLPIASVALSMSVIGLPVVFGWAKPIPVDFNLIRQPKKRNAGWIALAGPMANLILAATAGLGYLALPALGIAVSGAVGFVLSNIALMNVALFAFNMIPLPWLDGFKVLVGFLMPQKLYSKWIANPKFTAAYQRIYLHALNYEGPSWLLTKLNVRTQEQINGFTRAGSIALMGALSASLWMMLGVPFLFLALPCGYDYYCIRAKVRSEAAVEEMMDLMSEWGSVLAQIAEDYDVESEVNPRDVELNMVHAVDMLLEKLMKEEDFRRLSDKEKVKRFMGEFPKFASEDLVNLAFQHDSPEKILEILGDPRNGPYMRRLQSWLETHEIFKKMENPTEKKKYLDAHEKEKKKRAIGETGFDRSRNHAFTPFFLPAAAGFSTLAASSLEGLLAWLAASGIVAAALMIGNLSGRDSGDAEAQPETKIINARGAQVQGRFWVKFREGVSAEQARQALDRHGLTPESMRTIYVAQPAAAADGEVSPSYQKAQASVTDAATAGALAQRLEAENLVVNIVLHSAAVEFYGRAREAAAAVEEAQQELPLLPAPSSVEEASSDSVVNEVPEKIQTADDIENELDIWIQLVEGLDHQAHNAMMAAHGLLQADRTAVVDDAYIQVRAQSLEQAAAFARAFSGEENVLTVTVHSSIQALIAEARESEGTGAVETEPVEETQPAETETVAEAAALAKIVAGQNLGSNRGIFWVHFTPGTLRMHVDIILGRINMSGAATEVVTRAGQPLQLKVEARDAVTAGRLA
ncbi:MAG: site-2 protease family protein, partial [Elusimicrobiota bacterium]